MNVLPAIVIGGPPHAGKSVLAYNLSQALRRQALPHYLLRANPDGEGDWSHEIDPAVAQALRRKGAFDQTFVDRIVADLARRPLPFLVDAGGRPQPWQETIFAQCTAAILVSPIGRAYAVARRAWRARFAHHALLLVAEVRTQLSGAETVRTVGAQLHVTLSGLHRGATLKSPAFEELAAWVAAELAMAPPAVIMRHLDDLPVPSLLDLRLQPSERWVPDDLSFLSKMISADKPIAAYGRGPNWLYAWAAIHVAPAAFWLFDARLGWITTPQLAATPSSSPAAVAFKATTTPDGATRLDVTALEPWLDYRDAGQIALPDRLPATGIILSGKIPHWLTAAIARRLAPHQPWLAVYQPQLGGAVIVANHASHAPVGTVIATER